MRHIITGENEGTVYQDIEDLVQARAEIAADTDDY